VEEGLPVFMVSEGELLLPPLGVSMLPPVGGVLIPPEGLVEEPGVVLDGEEPGVVLDGVVASGAVSFFVGSPLFIALPGFFLLLVPAFFFLVVVLCAIDTVETWEDVWCADAADAANAIELNGANATDANTMPGINLFMKNLLICRCFTQHLR
jgi:hypothetical protein